MSRDETWDCGKDGCDAENDHVPFDKIRPFKTVKATNGQEDQMIISSNQSYFSGVCSTCTALISLRAWYRIRSVQLKWRETLLCHFRCTWMQTLYTRACSMRKFYFIPPKLHALTTLSSDISVVDYWGLNVLRSLKLVKNCAENSRPALANFSSYFRDAIFCIDVLDSCVILCFVR